MDDRAVVEGHPENSAFILDHITLFMERPRFLPPRATDFQNPSEGECAETSVFGSRECYRWSQGEYLPETGEETAELNLTARVLSRSFERSSEITVDRLPNCSGWDRSVGICER